VRVFIYIILIHILFILCFINNTYMKIY